MHPGGFILLTLSHGLRSLQQRHVALRTSTLRTPECATIAIVAFGLCFAADLTAFQPCTPQMSSGTISI